MQNRILEEASYYPWGTFLHKFSNFITTHTSCVMLHDLGMLITEFNTENCEEA
jgi:hypothetical protein